MWEVHWILRHLVCPPHKLQGATWSQVSCKSLHKTTNSGEMLLLLFDSINCHVWLSKQVRHIKTWREGVAKSRKVIIKSSNSQKRGRAHSFINQKVENTSSSSSWVSLEHKQPRPLTEDVSGSVSYLTSDLTIAQRGSSFAPSALERSFLSPRGVPGPPVRSSRPGADRMPERGGASPNCGTDGFHLALSVDTSCLRCMRGQH